MKLKKITALLQVQGENVLHFNLANKGLTMVTGCGHDGVLNPLDYARETCNEPIYAVYGGLHISPFEEWDAEHEQVIDQLTTYHIAHLGCNQCTEVKAVEWMAEKSMLVVRGSARHGSKAELLLGNGDMLEL